MNSLAIIDLNVANDLDRAALADVKGSGAWHQISASISTGNWSGYSQTSYSYQGITFHDGYLSAHSVEGWRRTRTQTEDSVWNHYVRL